MATGLEKLAFIPIPKKDNAKECLKYCTIALISHASKVMFKILQVRLQLYMNWELPDIEDGFREGRGRRDQIANIWWIIEKAREFQKNIYFCFIDYAKAFDCIWITTNCGKFFQMGIPEHLTYLLRNLYAGQETTVRTGLGRKVGSKLGKEYIKAVYCHPVYLTWMQGTSCNMPAWMRHKLESRLVGEISINSDKQMTPSLWQKAKKN